MMRKLLLLAAAAVLAAGCASAPGGSMGYYYTDDGLPGCAFRYGYYPSYDAGGPSKAARLDIARVERVEIPRVIGRDWASADRTYSSSGGWGNPADATAAGTVSSDRSVIAPAAPPPAPRIVAPRT
ncbi:MAG TPA: hypothetical protein VIA45_01195 [Thermoanaerobaculia bacterium]